MNIVPVLYAEAIRGRQLGVAGECRLQRCGAVAAVALALLLSPAAEAAPRVIYASPDGEGGYFDGVFHADAEALPVVLANLPRRRSEPIVVQLTTKQPGTAGVTYYQRPVAIASRGSGQAPLEIRGVRDGNLWLTRLRGPDLETTKCAPIRSAAARAACWERRPPAAPLLVASAAPPEDMLDAVGRVTAADALFFNRVAELLDEVHHRREQPQDVREPRDERSGPGGQGLQFYQLGDQNKRPPCVRLIESEHVLIRDLGFESCWLSAVFMHNSLNITLDDSLVLGSSYAFVVWNETGDPDKATGYTITDNLWIQDISGYGADRSPACRG